MNLNKIQNAILKTLAFYHIFQIPLEERELFYHLYQNKCNQKNFRNSLKIIISRNIIYKNGKYYSLINDEKIISSRLEKLSLAAKRWEKVHRVIKQLRWVPFIRFVAVVNSLSFNNIREESDIDLFVITQKKRLWTCRFLLILFLDLIGVNKNSRVQENRFCLGFWIDESKMGFEKFILKPEDIYFYYWIIHMKPVLGETEYRKLIRANEWIFKHFPNWKLPKYSRSKKSSKIKIILENVFGGWLGNIIENFLRKLQVDRIWKFPENSRSGASVVASQSILKLHAHDKRKIYETKYINILKKYESLTNEVK